MNPLQVFFTDMYRDLLVYLNPDYRRPLPTPEAVERWFTQRNMFGRTIRAQKQAILKIVLNEIRKSREELGFLLEDRHIYKEEWFFLYIVDCGGGFEGLRAVGFEGAVKYFAINEDIFFRNTSMYYFKREKGKPGSRSKYKCHLGAIRVGVLNEIFNNAL